MNVAVLSICLTDIIYDKNIGTKVFSLTFPYAFIAAFSFCLFFVLSFRFKSLIINKKIVKLYIITHNLLIQVLQVKGFHIIWSLR